MDAPQLVCPSVSWWTLGGFRLLVIGADVAVNTCAQDLSEALLCVLWGAHALSGTAGS